jgi:hypothetical protein
MLLTTCILIHVCPLDVASSRAVLTLILVSGRYFSFPSFDMYEANQQEGEKEAEKSP